MDQPESTAGGHAEQVAVANAVQASIAASDAICCALLQARSRGQSHREAVAMLAETQIGSGSTAARQRRARDLSQLLDDMLSLKNMAEYGVEPAKGGHLKKALRAATKLVGAAEEVLESP